MVDFKPMQTSAPDIEYYVKARSHFSLAEWRELLIRTMGYDPTVYTLDEQAHLLTRLCPLVQPKVNLIELAPKGTGKSYVFSRLSRHAWLISGGVVTRAQMFYNMNTKTAGVISRYDAIVLDEIQTIRFGNEGEIIGALKGYLEQGEFRVMQYKGTADASFVLLANVPLTSESRPRDQDLFKTLPDWLQGPMATALLDRFHGLLPGWEIRKISKECLCSALALKADYFGEILHILRQREEYRHWVKQYTRSSGNIRDITAVERLATAYLKLLFPNLSTVTPELFRDYCLLPAKRLRSNIRDQMSLVDQEYSPALADIDVHT
jgi:ATP-dependent Lon protease